MADAPPRRPARSIRGLSPRAAVLLGGASTLVGHAVLATMALAGLAFAPLDVSGLVVIPVLLTGVILMGLGPVVVAVAGGQPAWLGVVAVVGAFALWSVGIVWTGSLSDGAVLAVMAGALPVVGFTGALAVVGGGRVWCRLVGVAVVAALTGAGSHLTDAAAGVVYVGFVVAVGVLAWLSPRT